ncbi:MAG: hypothetical protein U0936_18480 [Planctomycetaceae bacterium]
MVASLIPNGGIGIHRHRDNQEIFMVLQNEVFMISPAIGAICRLVGETV